METKRLGRQTVRLAHPPRVALILMSIIPVIIFYLACQKYIIKGVAAGAVKG